MFKKILFKRELYHTSDFITKFSLKNFGGYRSNRLNHQYELEKGVYNKQKKETLKKHTQDFWEEQTKVENEWIQEFQRVQKEKKIRDENKYRTSFIRQSYMTYISIVNKHFNFFCRKKK